MPRTALPQVTQLEEREVPAAAMFADIMPGVWGSYPLNLTASGSKLFFSADNGHGYELYVTDGTRLWTTVAVERLPGSPYLLAGLPYVADDAEGLRRIADADVASAGDLWLTHPAAEGPEFFDARADTTQELAAFALAADPRGYGNPDEGWSHLVASTAIEATPAPGAPDDLDVFAVRHGGSGEVFDPTFDRVAEGLRVRTEAFTAVIGDPAGDDRGEPTLTLRP